MLVTVLLAAIPYGTVNPWYTSLFVFLACFFATLRIVPGILPNTVKLFADRLLFAPLLGILLLAVVQILPLSSGVISLDFFETKFFILTFAGLLLTGEVLLHYTTTQKRLEHLIYLVLTVGIGSALFGLVRQFTPAESLFSADTLGEQVQCAQFVNRNHFAYLMEMTLGLLVGLLLKADFSDLLKPILWVMIALVGFSIISTNSRGGILSAVGLVLFAGSVHLLTGKRISRSKKNKSRVAELKGSRLRTVLVSLMFSVLLFGVAVFTVAFVGGDAVTTRIETIQSEIADDENKEFQRRDIWETTLALIKDNPFVGAGFGAYSAAITKYDKTSGRFSLEQAHNDYLEITAAGGLTAFSLMLFFMTVLVKRIQKQFSSPNKFRRASCFGAALGICGVLLHSVTEFGLHVIVNALIFIILVLIATADIDNPAEVSA